MYKLLEIKPFFVTDLDNTSWTGDVSNVYLGYVLKNNLIKLPDNAMMLKILEKYLQKEAPEAAEALRQKTSLELLAWAYDRHLKDDSIDGLTLFNLLAATTFGYTRAELDVFIHDFFENGYETEGYGRPFKERVYGEQRSLYVYFQEQGIDGWAISAGLDFLAAEGATYLGLPREHVRASVLAYDEEGRSLGFCKRNIFSIKHEEVLSIAEEINGLPMAAYGDSIMSDMPMFLWPDFVNRFLDVDDSGRQMALSPEFKAKRQDDQKTPLLVEEINKEFGTRIEFHPQPTLAPKAVK
jgi:phosphoserine phosphatase